MSGVTGSRGEMMQVTPDVARDQRELSAFYFFFCKRGEKLKENLSRRNNVPNGTAHTNIQTLAHVC